MERLYAESITHQPERSFTVIKHGEGEHPRKTLNCPRNTPFLKRREHRLCVRTAAKGVSARDELRTKVDVVIDFAVKNDLKAATTRAHRLSPHRREIEDRESTKSESGPRSFVEAHALVIGAAVHQTAGHCAQGFGWIAHDSSKVDEARESAHGVSVSHVAGFPYRASRAKCFNDRTINLSGVEACLREDSRSAAHARATRGIGRKRETGGGERFRIAYGNE